MAAQGHRPRATLRLTAPRAASYTNRRGTYGLAPKTSFWRDAQFDTLRLAFVKIAARVSELVTRIKVSLPSSYPYKESLARFAGRAVARPP